MNLSEKRHTNESGFTLMEVLISIILLSFGMLSLVSSMSAIQTYQNRADSLTEATILTTAKMEELKRIGTNEPTGGAFGFNYLVSDYLTDESLTENSNQQYTKTETLGDYTRTWYLNIYPSSSSQNFDVPLEVVMVEAVVNTAWTDLNGITRNVELGAVLHRRQFLE